MPITKLLSQEGKLLEYHQGTFTLQIPHNLSYAVLRGNLDAHMDMIHTCICFHYFYHFVFT